MSVKTNSIIVFNVDTSAANVDTSTANVDTSTANVDTSATNVETSPAYVDSTKIYSKRLSKDQIEEKIMEICENEFISLPEIAKLIERTTSYLQNHILPQMLETKKIVRLYPTIINHPSQAYKKAE